MKMYKKYDVETSEDGNVTIKVEKNSTVEDTEDNNPESQIKMMITNNKSKEKSSVVIKLYHTNQSIHLQGGRRMGNVTSTSLLADCLERHWRKNTQENMCSIKETNDKLKVMMVKPGMTIRTRTNTAEAITLYCDKCSYTSTMRHRLNTHKISCHISCHTSKIKPLKVTASKRKSSPIKSPATTKIPKGKMTTSAETEVKPKVKSPMKTHPCPVCGFVYNSETDLTSHMSTMHNALLGSKTSDVSILQTLQPKEIITLASKEQEKKEQEENYLEPKKNEQGHGEVKATEPISDKSVEPKVNELSNNEIKEKKRR